jgi:hypothetical protein
MWDRCISDSRTFDGRAAAYSASSSAKGSVSSPLLDAAKLDMSISSPSSFTDDPLISFS